MGLMVLPAAPSLSKSFTVILGPDEKSKAEAPWSGVIHDIHGMVVTLWPLLSAAQVITGHIIVLLYNCLNVPGSPIVSRC